MTLLKETSYTLYSPVEIQQIPDYRVSVGNHGSFDYSKHHGVGKDVLKTNS